MAFKIGQLTLPSGWSCLDGAGDGDEEGGGCRPHFAAAISSILYCKEAWGRLSLSTRDLVYN